MRIEKGRLGSFFIFVGLVLWVIFFIADQVNETSYGYFLVGTAALLFGGYLWWRDMKPAPESGRFRTWRRMRQKSVERKARKKKKKEEQQPTEQ